MSPTKSGKVGQVITMWHDSPERKILADSLPEWFDILIKKIVSDNQACIYDKEYLHKAMDKSDSGIYDKALLMFTKYLSKNPDSLQALTERARVYLEINKYELAEMDLNNILEISANKLEPTQALIEKYKKEDDLLNAVENLQILSGIHTSEKVAKQMLKQVSNFYESKGFV